jgi:hypothetical protein
LTGKIEQLYIELQENKKNLEYHLAEKAAGSFLEDAEIDESRRRIDEIEEEVAEYLE